MTDSNSVHFTVCIHTYHKVCQYETKSYQNEWPPPHKLFGQVTRMDLYVQMWQQDVGIAAKMTITTAAALWPPSQSRWPAAYGPRRKCHSLSHKTDWKRCLKADQKMLNKWSWLRLSLSQSYAEVFVQTETDQQVVSAFASQKKSLYLSERCIQLF